jgi:transcriptional regulator with XRE-family HTH domain
MELGGELREARVAAGLTLAACAVRLGWSRQRWARIEQARCPGFALDDLHRMAAVLGLAVNIRCYPVGPPLRDIGQLAVIARLRPRLAPTWKVRLAFDLLLELKPITVAVEVITRLRDVQAQLRIANLKWRDGRATRLVIVIAATHLNRRALGGASGVLDDDFPLGTRAILAAFAAGRDPGANGIALL